MSLQRSRTIVVNDSIESVKHEGEMDMAARLYKSNGSEIWAATLGSNGKDHTLGYELSEVCKLCNEGRCHYQVCMFKCACSSIPVERDHPAAAKPNCYGRVMGWYATDPMHHGQIFRGREQGLSC